MDFTKTIKDLTHRCEQVEGAMSGAQGEALEDLDMLLTNGLALEAIAKALGGSPTRVTRSELKEFSIMYTEFESLFQELVEEDHDNNKTETAAAGR